MTSIRAFHRWSALSLSRQFTLLASLLLMLAVAFLGNWMSTRIRDAVKEDVGFRASLYLQHVLEPFVPELARDGTLSPESRALFTQELGRAATGFNVAQSKLWSLEGRVIVASEPDLEGRVFPVEDGLAEAMAGEVAIESDTSIHGRPLLEGDSVFEVYVPIRNGPGGPVVAVAEFYQDSGAIMAILAWTRLQTWAIVALVSFCLLAGLYRVVDKGNATILRQRAELNDKVAELTRLLNHNEYLRKKIQGASTRSAEDSETHLRRIGADLHDGVGQILTIAALKLEGLFPSGGRNGDYLSIKSMLDDAMAEVRAMASGLSLPQMQGLPLARAVASVAMKHGHRTATDIRLDLADDLPEPGQAVRLAICRFVQEGLSNAFKHAGGVGQSVALRQQGAWLVAEVSDRGPGLGSVDPDPGARHQSLGLAGLRNRVESLGGEFRLSSTPGRGTTVTAYFPKDSEDIA